MMAQLSNPANTDPLNLLAGRARPSAQTSARGQATSAAEPLTYRSSRAWSTDRRFSAALPQAHRRGAQQAQWPAHKVDCRRKAAERVAVAQTAIVMLPGAFAKSGALY